jgi:aryl-alcohol dehydrogenase-like predicted oxidoreductase
LFKEIEKNTEETKKHGQGRLTRGWNTDKGRAAEGFFLRFCLHVDSTATGQTAPIIGGTTQIQQLKEIFLAVDITLSAEEVAALEEPYRLHPILGHEQPKPPGMVK